MQRAKFGDLEKIFLKVPTSAKQQWKDRRNTIWTSCLGSIVSDFAFGLLQFHDNGYIHRDLAARNLLMDEEAKVIIADYGLTRKVENGLAYRTRNEIDLPHTCDAYSTRKTDIRAFGVTLLEILKGDVYPENFDINIALGSIANFPQELQTVIKLCVDPDANRGTNARQILENLQPLRQDRSALKEIMQRSEFRDLWDCT